MLLAWLQSFSKFFNVYIVHSTKIKVGDVFHTIYPAFGIGVDFGYGSAGIKYSTTIELRGEFGFDPPPSTIILECEEM